MAEYQVKFEVFEGPLDLLLYLIKKEEVSIYEVNLTRLASQFIEHIELMRLLDLEVAGEFVVMASTLMYIKSRELLPVDKQVVVQEEEEGEDPRWELIRQLVEYKKFKDAAATLQELEATQEQVYPRLPGKLEFPVEEPGRPQVSLFDLVNAVSRILKRFGDRQSGDREIYADRWTVSEKIEELLFMTHIGHSISFSRLFGQTTSRTEVVVTFLAMLELIRLKHLVVVQGENFGEIELTRVVPTAPIASPSVPEEEEPAPALPSRRVQEEDLEGEESEGTDSEDNPPAVSADTA